MAELHDVLICTPLRTPVGGYGGVFRDVPVTTLASTVLSTVVQRSGVPVDAVDDVLLGQCYPNGEAPAIGRVAALDAGLPVAVTGLQIDRRCGSGLQAVLDAAMRIQTGVADVVIAGGADSMSQAEHYVLGARWGLKGRPADFADRLARGRVTAGGHNHPVPGGMIETAENLRADYQISREDQDALAAQSHRRAVAAQEAGLFDEQIVPVSVPQRKADPLEVTTDEHPRPDSTPEALASLRPIMGRTVEGATVTAGNASGQNDGAAMCVVASRAAVEEHGLTPLARLVSWGLGGVRPSHMGLGPVPATVLALERAGLSLADMDLIELNEAFAAQVLAVTSEWGFGPGIEGPDWERTNVNGSGISLGHPVGATGARILSTMLHEMHRRDARLGLETMCIGGGQGLAAIFEKV
ncbi:acetyl-CoA C-acetyltransferase [Euzebya tangerina]|uniref:acetyl-CoA C-acetyltransferase n=1 Tax=Euzebya tangerina TaxID=591198 RepID=UPI000E316424|nr:acetyl-CoA C-acetyltransferase [Euzebya tangerina]